MYDGSITIDTRVDTKGLNQGTKNITKALTGVLNSVKSIMKLFTMAFIGGEILGFLRNMVQGFDVMGSAVGDKIKPLADALANLKGAFVNLLVQALLPLIPYLVSFVQWLTVILQTVTQLIAALFGFKSTVGSIMTDAAKGAKKAADAAKGALAAFDQINVLQQNKPDNQDTGITATPAPITISPEILKQAEELKKKLLEIKDIILSWWNDPLGNLEKLWGNIKDWFSTNVTDPLKEKWSGFVNYVTSPEGKANVLAGVSGAFGILPQWLNANVLLPMRQLWEDIWVTIKSGALDAWETLKGVWTAAGGFLTPILSSMVETFSEKFTLVKDLIESIKTTFSGIITFLNGVFTQDWERAWDGINQVFEGVISGWKAIFQAALNGVIDLMNGLLRGLSNGLNGVINALNSIEIDIPEWVPIVGGQTFSVSIPTVSVPQIPRLASGAVIPPNAQFAAILGDQTNGKNLEAPEGLIRQIIREEMGNLNNDITIPVQLVLDGEVIYKNQQRVSRRHGKSLIAGGAA